jgi:VanZ family protein
MKKGRNRHLSKWLLFYWVALIGVLAAPFQFDLSPLIAPIERLRQGNGVEISSTSGLRSIAPAERLYESFVSGRGISIEVWLETNDIMQAGPARIVSYSLDTGLRNFTLGQEGRDLVLRVRTTQTDLNGDNPAMQISNVFVPGIPMHLVATYDHGIERLYMNGKMVSEIAGPGGGFSNWEPGYPLVLGNEATGNRPWKGRLFLAALYNRALSSEEVFMNYRADRHFKDAAAASEARASDGLVAFYLFDEIHEKKVSEQSGVAPPLDLEVLTGQQITGKPFLTRFPWDPSSRFDEVKDILGNILLFVPFGFLFHAFLGVRHGQTVKTVAFVMVVGTLFSLMMESLQYLIISRDSSLIDVINNSVGTALGIVAERFDLGLFLRLRGVALDTEKSIE